MLYNFNLYISYNKTN